MKGEITMKRNDKNTFIGNQSLKNQIEIFNGKALLYRHCGTKPENLIVQMDKGEGRSSFMEYAIGKFKELSTIDFSTSRDEFIECEFDGSLQNFRNIMTQIDSVAEYANVFTGGISVNCTYIANRYTEKHFEDFISRFAEISAYAWVVFFFSLYPSRNEENLMDKLKQKVKHITLVAEPYTKKELANIFLNKIHSYGIDLVHEDKLLMAVSNLLTTNNIKTAKQTIALAVAVLDYIDYDCSQPKLSFKSINNLNEELRKKEAVKK